MGKRARKRGDAPGRAEARHAMAERQLGIQLSGVSKPMLDAMNAESKARYRLGIGVLVQEEERASRIVASLSAELEGKSPLGRLLAWDVRRALRRAREERELWSGRLREVARAVSEKAPGREVERWAASR